jgi:hypothetical protein
MPVDRVGAVGVGRDHGAGNLAQFGVAALGAFDETVEGLVGGEVVQAHQHTLGLVDLGAGDERLLQLPDVLLRVGPSAGVADRGRCGGGQ